MERIKERIKKARPDLSDSSVRAYLTSIRKIYRELFNDTEKYDIKQLNSFAKVRKYLETLNITTRRNAVIATIVVLKAFKASKRAVEKYTKYLEETSSNIQANYSGHAKNNKDEDNWITRDEIEAIRNTLEEKAAKIIAKNKKQGSPTLKQNELDIIQKHLVLCFYTMMPPMRNDCAETLVYERLPKDFCNDCCQNFINLEKEQMVLCRYKTSKTYGSKVIQLPPALVALIRRWMQYNPTQYLLINPRNREMMKKNTLTHYLNRIFKPKKVSTTLLRKIYLSEKYPVRPADSDMLRDAHIMGHSVQTQQTVYRKK